MNDLKKTLQEWKVKNGLEDYAKRDMIILEREREIRERIMQIERFKMITIENYTLNAYAIDTLPIIQLLNTYKMIEAYNIDESDPDYLTFKNNIDINEQEL